MKKMKKILFIILSFFLISSHCVELSFVDKEDTSAKIKSLLIYNFTRNFEWPTKMRQGNFVICTIGMTPGLKIELDKLAISKMVENQKIEIKSVEKISEAGKCNILYLNDENSDLLASALKSYKNKGTLLITEKAGLGKAGSLINFVVLDSKQKFELNINSVTKSGLKVSDKLKELAITVYK